VSHRDSGGSGHQGADLSNGRGGGAVRAAGNGLVVVVGGKGWNHGYGRHVVLAHRFLDGALVYSVYAHLAPRSVTVRPGQMVSAGRVVGRVGMTGRAISPHLHFEVRAPEDPGARWEHAPVSDPLAFVAARRPTPRADTSWARPYLEWAECAALIRAGDESDRPMSRTEWWRALAAGTRDPSVPWPADGERLRTTLVEAGLLPDEAGGDPDAPLGWREFARDLRRARELGMRLPWSPVGPDPRRRDCHRELGVDSPAHHPEAIGEGRDGRLSRAAACLALADVAGDPPPAARAAKRRPPPAHPAG
jgi:murein DD-endopeptidase MepM/ murein hydrolase activator NlpD